MPLVRGLLERQLGRYDSERRWVVLDPLKVTARPLIIVD